MSDIAALRAQYGERLEWLLGAGLDKAMADLVGRAVYFSRVAGLWLNDVPACVFREFGMRGFWQPSTDRRDLAEAEAAWLTTKDRWHAYGNILIDRCDNDDPMVTWEILTAKARLLPPDVCCRALLLAAGECER